VLFLQEEATKRFGAPVPRVKGRVRAMQGGFSGGTAASLKATLAAVEKNPEVGQLLVSPFALTPGFEGAPQPTGAEPYEDASVGAWVTPFIMAMINTKNVHRSNFLMDFRYGKDFQYDEMAVTGPGEAGEQAARALAAIDPLGGGGGPRPGEGPTKAEREAGHYDVLFIGEAADGRTIRAGVTGDMDPGYGSTSKMISESALCLLDDSIDTPGGVWTPAPALGTALIARLQAHAGLTFAIED